MSSITYLAMKAKYKPCWPITQTWNDATEKLVCKLMLPYFLEFRRACRDLTAMQNYHIPGRYFFSCYMRSMHEVKKSK